MNRRFVVTGSAVAVLISLATYVVLKEDTKTTREAATRAIFDFEKDTINKITVINDSGTFKFENMGDVWKLVDPGPFPVEERRMSAMRSALRRLTAVSIVWPTASGVDRQKVGLASGATRVTFQNDDDDTNYTLEIGDLHPRGDEYYVARADRPSVYTVHKWTLEVFQKELTDFRRRQVLSASRREVTAVSVFEGDKERLAARREDAAAHRHP